MIAKMKEYVINRDLPQCKQLIRDYIKEVIVYRNHVEVVFNMVFVIGNSEIVYFDNSKRENFR